MMQSFPLTSFFHRIYLFLLCLIAVGTPLIFSSLTRSVFEVNKLLLFRGATLLFLAFWALELLLKHYYGARPDSSESYTLFGFRWRRVGLELPLLLYVIVTLITCVFSRNVWLAVIGSYDRWEGIFTFLNYMLLILMVVKSLKQKLSFFVLFFALFIATILSAFYGVFQSLGFDMMAWSADPTFRVFACINNPVHFCAFMGMVLPFVIAMYFYFYEGAGRSHRKNVDTLKPYLFRLMFYVLSVALSLALLFWVGAESLITPFFICVFILAFYFLLDLRLKAYGRIALTIATIFSLLTILFLYGFMPWLCFSVVLIFACFYTFQVYPNWQMVLARLFLLGVFLVLYVQILSYSRATFVGFSLFLPFLFVILSRFSMQTILKRQLFYYFFYLLFTTVLVLFYMFNIFSYGLKFGIIFLLLYALFLVGFYFFYRSVISKGAFLVGSVLLLLLQLPFLFSSWPWIANVLPLFFFSFFVFLKYRPSFLPVAFVNFIVLFFLKVQFLHLGFFHFLAAILFYLGLCFIVYLSKDIHLRFSKAAFYRVLGILFFPFVLAGILFLKQQAFDFLYNYHLWYVVAQLCFYLFILFGVYAFFQVRITRVFKYSFLLFSFCSFVLIVGLYRVMPDLLLDRPSNTVGASSFAARSQDIFNENRTKKNSRLYMWTSVPAWFKDHVMFGSGLDTIKFLYPLYRDPVYGIYEGAHNFTPDRLHNEYLNTLVTRGIVGTFVYYILCIGGVYLILFRAISMAYSSWRIYFLAAVVVGLGVYLGQVIFNFGVLPTLVLFYLIFGIGLALSRAYLMPAKEELHD